MQIKMIKFLFLRKEQELSQSKLLQYVDGIVWMKIANTLYLQRQ